MVLGYAVGKWTGEPKPDSDATDIRFFAPDARPPLPFPAHRERLALFDKQSGNRLLA